MNRVTATQVATLAAAALAVGALVFWFWKRRENWEFAKPGIAPLAAEDKQRIRDLCRSGKTWAQITADDSLQSLSKYNADAARKVCTNALKRRKGRPAAPGKSNMAPGRVMRARQ